MKKFQILRYLNRWKYLIFIVSLLGGLFCYSYFSQKQFYVASATIRYANEQAASGKTPSGEDIDVSQIYSSKLITQMIEDLGVSMSIEQIRKDFDVEGIISEEDIALQKAKLEAGEEYTIFPTEYKVSYTADSSTGADFAKRILDSVLKYYFVDYGEKYVDQALLPNNAASVVDTKYDYLERVELLDGSLDDILAYVDSKRDMYGNFRSSESGYSFEDLYNIFDYIKENSISYLFADILNSRITMDKDMLIKKYQERVDENNLKIIDYQEKLTNLKGVIDSYTDKNVEGIFKKDEAGGNDNRIIDFINPKSYTEGTVDTTTVYDGLIYTYVYYATHLEYAKIDNQYCADVMADFLGEAKSVTATVNDVEKDIQEVVKEQNAAYDMLVRTVYEFNQYLAADSLTILSDITVKQGIDIRLYLILTVFVFFVIGCAGSVVIGRAEDIIEYVVYVDRKTGLPNRARCDAKIAAYEKGLLPDDVSCVSIYLKSLRSLSEVEGYEAGDEQLKKLSELIKQRAARLGFVGYNGAGQFLCLFDDCTYEKAELFVENLSMAINEYNDKDRKHPMDVLLNACESRHDNVYEIRALIRKATQR